MGNLTVSVLMLILGASLAFIGIRGLTSKKGFMEAKKTVFKWQAAPLGKGFFYTNLLAMSAVGTFLVVAAIYRLLAF